MISISKLIELEKAELDRYGEERKGSELAEFVAKRTRAYMVQEIVNYIKRKNGPGAEKMSEEIELRFGEF